MEVVLVGGTTRVPLVADAVAEFFGRRPRSEIDPLHAVSLGAALHAALVAGIPVRAGALPPTPPATPGAPARPAAPDGEALLIDVLPHSIGIAIAGGGVEVILPRYSVVPTEEKRRFTTWRADQTDMRFVLVQGDEAKAAENYRLGDFVALKEAERLYAGIGDLCRLVPVPDSAKR